MSAENKERAGRFETEPKRLLVTRESRYAILTFGGQTFATAQGQTYFYFDKVLEKNLSFTVIASGLNHYIFESDCINL